MKGRSIDNSLLNVHQLILIKQYIKFDRLNHFYVAEQYFLFWLFKLLIKMTKVLTGIQSSGLPHLGNILGSIIPAIELSKEKENLGLYFIADLHTLTSVKNSELRTNYTYNIAATWLSFGLNSEKNIFYRQSKIPEVCELTWYLSCFAPYPMLANAHSFKDKSRNLSDVNAGLFTYPVLMASDILLYDTQIVPVGKDQLQHIEITRDIARSFNHKYEDIFTIPEPRIDEKLKIIPGSDGRKMSKSYNNTLNIFLPEKDLKKGIMSIKTDSTPIAQPKNPDTCNVFQIYKCIASEEDTKQLQKRYLNGNYGYGQAKNELFHLILERFSVQRNLFNEYIKDIPLLNKKLEIGEEKARTIAQKKIKDIRKVLGY